MRTNVDYADEQITVYRECPYRCAYCWAQLPLFRARIQRGKYDPEVEAAKAAVRCKGRIVVSFTTDPYPPQELELKRTRRVLEALRSYGAREVWVLTKNPKLALRDLDLYGPDWRLGTTIVSLTKTIWEPYAPPPEARRVALKEAKERGVKTWLSIEPYLPGVTYPFRIVFETHEYVDLYVLGTCNYARKIGVDVEKLEAELKCGTISNTIALLQHLRKPFIIKGELREQLERLGEWRRFMHEAGEG